MKANQQLPQIGFVRLPTVLLVTGMGKSKIWQMAKDGTFPKPYKLAARVTAWKASELSAWIDAQIPHGEGTSHVA